MSANVESMAYVGETPWHGIGSEIIGDYCYDAEEFMVAAGLDHECEKVPLKTFDGQDIPDVFAVRRTSDNKIVSGQKTVGKNYTVLQSRVCIKWFQPFLTDRQAALHTAGSLAEGSRIWALAKLNRDPMDILPGDTVEKFILLSHSHDGTLAVRVGFTPIRVVCCNTLAMAHNAAASKLIRLKHSRDVVQNLENVREIMNLANQEFEATAEQYRALARKTVNQNDMVKYVKTVLGVKEGEEISTRTKNIIEEILGYAESGKGQDIPGVRGTYWSLVQGISEWVSYSRGHNQDSRLNNLFYGKGAELNKLALETALAMAV
jgi:phage/plasmid-like protein (TIGR03299 family)